MQKVVSINVNSRPSINSEKQFGEYEFPILNKYLEDGYKVINVYQQAPSTTLYCFTITFILEK